MGRVLPWENPEPAEVPNPVSARGRSYLVKPAAGSSEIAAARNQCPAAATGSAPAPEADGTASPQPMRPRTFSPQPQLPGARMAARALRRAQLRERRVLEKDTDREPYEQSASSVAGGGYPTSNGGAHSTNRWNFSSPCLATQGRKVGSPPAHSGKDHPNSISPLRSASKQVGSLEPAARTVSVHLSPVPAAESQRQQQATEVSPQQEQFQREDQQQQHQRQQPVFDEQRPVAARFQMIQPTQHSQRLAGSQRSPSRSRRASSAGASARRTSNGEAHAPIADDRGGSALSACAGDSNPFKLKRFVDAQKAKFPQALREIQGGRKSTCWMWFVIPTPPHIVDNVEKGSSMNRRYALRTDEEARAFLEFEADGVNLRSNYLDIMSEVRDQLRAGVKLVSLVGNFDGPKLVSSATLFERITRGRDVEIHGVVREILDILGVASS